MISEDSIHCGTVEQQAVLMGLCGGDSRSLSSQGNRGCRPDSGMVITFKGLFLEDVPPSAKSHPLEAPQLSAWLHKLLTGAGEGHFIFKLWQDVRSQTRFTLCCGGRGSQGSSIPQNRRIFKWMQMNKKTDLNKSKAEWGATYCAELSVAKTGSLTPARLSAAFLYISGFVSSGRQDTENERHTTAISACSPHRVRHSRSHSSNMCWCFTMPPTVSPCLPPFMGEDKRSCFLTGSAAKEINMVL